MKFASVRLVSTDVPALAAFYHLVTGATPFGVDVSAPSSNIAVSATGRLNRTQPIIWAASARKSDVLQEWSWLARGIAWSPMPQDIGREDKGPVEESRDCIEDWTVAEDVGTRGVKNVATARTLATPRMIPTNQGIPSPRCSGKSNWARSSTPPTPAMATMITVQTRPIRLDRVDRPASNDVVTVSMSLPTFRLMFASQTRSLSDTLL
jgi:hypothetical protein